MSFELLSDRTSFGVAVHFSLEADAFAGLLPRVMEPFAKRDLTPDRVQSHRVDGVVHIEIGFDAMPAEVVHLVEGNLRSIVGIRSLSRAYPDALRQVA